MRKSGLKAFYIHSTSLEDLLGIKSKAPEVKLWGAVLLRAILDLCHDTKEDCRNTRKNRRGNCKDCYFRDKAVNWFKNGRKGEIHNFINVCDTLDLEPEVIINQLKKGELL